MFAVWQGTQGTYSAELRLVLHAPGVLQRIWRGELAMGPWDTPGVFAQLSRSLLDRLRAFVLPNPVPLEAH